jgi:hypothetical protein
MYFEKLILKRYNIFDNSIISFTILFFLEKNPVFNIFENNIINVEVAKVIGYVGCCKHF